jgi:hypothetical protein
MNKCKNLPLLRRLMIRFVITFALRFTGPFMLGMAVPLPLHHGSFIPSTYLKYGEWLLVIMFV